MVYIPNYEFSEVENNNYFETFSEDYEVKINSVLCKTNVCRVSAMPFNRWWPGHQRDVMQSELASFINFYGDEKVVLEIKCNRKFKKCVVRPLSKNVATIRNGDIITVVLEKNGNYVFETDDTHFALHIFYNAPIETVNPNDVTYYFGPGIHRPLLINLKSNESLYIHPEAIVYTSVYCENAENVRVFGGGILNNSSQERVTADCYDKSPLGNIRMFDTKGIIIEDVILMDSANWICALFNCEDIFIKNIKLVGHWRYNTDGIDLINSSNAKIQNCFIRSFDDSICVKAIYNHKCCENIAVENCVCWCDWGKTLEIGLETAAEKYCNISYTNCDLIHNSTAAMAISNGNYAKIQNITYENINIEFQAYTRQAVLQENDEMTYPENIFASIGEIIKIDNAKFCVDYSFNIADERDKQYGKTIDISYNNICVYTDEGMGKVRIRLQSQSPEALLKDVKINNIVINSTLLESLDDAEIIIKNAENIFYNNRNHI